MQKIFITFLQIFLLLAVVTAHAEIYKWVDENGRIHYGDRPTGQQTDTLDIKNAPTQPATSPSDVSDRLEKQQRYLQAREIERDRKRQEQEKQRQIKEKRERDCERVKVELERARRASGIYETDKKGERVFMDKQQRASYEAELQRVVDKLCK